MSRVGIIGDTHIPYELEGYLDFCKHIFKLWKVDTVVHIGDLVDHHALSFHESEPSLKGANGELSDARDHLQPWYKAFPKLTLITGNHDLVPARQLKKIGLDDMIWLRSLKEVYDMPKGWDIKQQHIIENVIYHHGYSSNGVNGFRNDATHRMQSSVSGHNHSNAGVSASASDHRLVFGLATGCGVDNTKMAFAYGKHFLKKPIVSCGIVVDGKHPFVEYMDLGEK